MPEVSTTKRGGTATRSARVARRLSRAPKRAAKRAKRLVEGIAFWTGVSLPFLYIPMVAIGKGAELITFVGLVAVNYLALIVGAGHDRGSGD